MHKHEKKKSEPFGYNGFQVQRLTTIPTRQLMWPWEKHIGSGVATGVARGGQSDTPDREKFAKNLEKSARNQEKLGKIQEESGKKRKNQEEKGKIGKFLSLCPS